MAEPSGRHRVVVVGANAAGMSAAHQSLRRSRSNGRDVEVIALEATNDTSYSACGIPYWLVGDVESDRALVARTAEQHRALGVDLRLGCRAVEIDPDRQVITYRSSDGAEVGLGFDDLVLATGAEAIVPDWARDGSGATVPGVHPLKHLDDGRIWQQWLAQLPPGQAKTVTIVGGGYIGVEMAEVLLRSGVPTRLVARSRVLSSIDEPMSRRVQEAMRSGGCDVVTDTMIAAVETEHGRASGIVTDSGTVLPTRLVLVGTGVRPDTTLGRAAGIEVGESGGYVPDDGGRLGDGIWAAGDCCEVVHRVTGRRVFQPLGSHANKQGRVVGDNIGGGRASFPGVVGTSITRFGSRSTYVEVARTGLSTAQSERAGIPVVSLLTEGTTASGYMPQASPIAITVLANPEDGRLTGMQIVGGHDSGKRIDIAASALWTGQTLADVAESDLAYAPPFATAWEITQIACRRLAERL